MVIQLKNGIAVTILANEKGFIFDLNNKTYYYIKNDTAARIMDALTVAKGKGGGLPASTIISYILALFDVPGENQAEVDVMDFLLNTLQPKGIIEETPNDVLLPAPTIYPWDKREYVKPQIEQTPDQMAVQAKGQYPIKAALPKILVPKDLPSE